MALSIQGGTNSVSIISKRNNWKAFSSSWYDREKWANKEANILIIDDLIINNKQFSGAFVLLYEMLKEYGTHLVDAAWNHQVYNHVFTFF